MIIYLLIILVILLFGKKINKKEYSYADFIVLLLLILIAGLRYNIGTDYAMYYGMYFNQDDPNLEKVEIGYKVLMDISYKVFQDNFVLFFIFCAILTIIPIYALIKKYSKYPTESLFYFVTLGFYVLSFNMVRQAIAMAFAFYALKFLFDRKFLRYIIVVIFASLFHMTALIMIPMYWLSNFKFNTKKLLTILVILLFSGFLFNPIFNYVTTVIPQYSMYSSYQEMKAGIGTYIINSIYILLIIIIIINKKRIDEKSENDNYNKVINVITFSTFFIILSMQNTLMARLIYYWLMPIVLILPEMIRCVKENYRNTLQALVLLFFIAFYIIHIYSFNGVYPYRSIYG